MAEVMPAETEVTGLLWNSQNDKFNTFLKSPEPIKAHNHLLDTKIFATLGDNGLLQTRPASINFEGFAVGSTTYTQRLRIINMSSQCQRMHIIPPSLEEFRISYKKIDSLVPGMYLEVDIIFKPTKNEPYHDCIRIHSEAFNLIVPIHAYLHMDVTSFPSNINFNPTVVGQSSSKRYKLVNTAAIDFKFQVSFVEKHASYKIHPVDGTIPANKHVNITITYAPTEYCTACAKIQIVVFQFNSQPHICTLIGSSGPGLAITKLEQKESQKTPIDPRTINPLGRSRAKKRVESARNVPIKVPDKSIYKDSIQFPKNLNTPAAVNHVMMQKAGKMKARDVREAIKQQASMSISSMPNSKQMKEAVFKRLVHEIITEEERNQLRWGVRLGDCCISEESESEVLADRQKDFVASKVNSRDEELIVEYNRPTTVQSNPRIIRPANEFAQRHPSSNFIIDDEWEERHRILNRFIQAARKVIIRQRAERNVKFLKEHLDSWRKGKLMSTKPKPKPNKEELIVDGFDTTFKTCLLKPFSFPAYVDSVNKDDMAVDAIGLLSVPPTTVHLKTEVKTYKLKVPQLYKLSSYNVHNFTTSVNKFVPKTLSRELRTGAESEITQIEYQSKDIELFASSSHIETQHPTETTRLTAPLHLLEAKKYHPMHLFNPLPGVQVHAQPLPYSEVDPHYNLCPLQQGNKRLDNNDQISGVLTWKRFPSHGLIAMNGASFSQVFLPRRSDPFFDDLFTMQVPPLLTSLPDDDVMFQSDDEEQKIVPTMEMVQNEFKTKELLNEGVVESCESCVMLQEGGNLPSSNNPQSKLGAVERRVMEESFENYLRETENVLGKRIQANVDSLKTEWGIK